MRSIEEKIDIPESRKDDFRREIMNYIGALAIEGKQFNYRTNERLVQGARAEAVRGPARTRSSSRVWYRMSWIRRRRRRSTS